MKNIHTPITGVDFQEKRIPQKIHFVFLSKDEPIPEIFNHCIENTKALHPNWEINFYNEEDAHELINTHFPGLESLYYSYPLTVQRADIIRIIIVYLFGGFYLDMDMYCLKSLEPLLKFNLVLGEEKYLEKYVCTHLNLKNQQRVANYMFGGIPEHPFWLDFLNTVVEKSFIKIQEENDVLESTGPGLLTDFYHDNKYLYSDIVILKNADRFCLNEGHREIACHFGNFAAHLHLGTWRWKRKNHTTFEKKEVIQETITYPEKYEINRKDDFAYLANVYDDTADYFNFYNTIKIIGKPLPYNTKLTDKKILYFGAPELYTNNIPPESKNVFFGTFSATPFSVDKVKAINKFSYCIVPSEQIKQFYLSQNIKTKTIVIEPAFTRYNRNFEDDIDSTCFTIGCFAASHTQESLISLVAACKNSTHSIKPQIAIKLYDPNKEFEAFFNDLKKTETSILFNYTSITLSVPELSIWFKDVICMFFGSSSDKWPLSVLESIYMGLLVIVPNTENYKALLKKIPVDPFISFDITNAGAAFNNDVIVKNIEGALLKACQNFENYSTKTIQASQLIEDEWSPEETRQNVLNFLQTI